MSGFELVGVAAALQTWAWQYLSAKMRLRTMVKEDRWVDSLLETSAL